MGGSLSMFVDRWPRRRSYLRQKRYQSVQNTFLCPLWRADHTKTVPAKICETRREGLRELVS